MLDLQIPVPEIGDIDGQLRAQQSRTAIKDYEDEQDTLALLDFMTEDNKAELGAFMATALYRRIMQINFGDI